MLGKGTLNQIFPGLFFREFSVSVVLNTFAEVSLCNTIGQLDVKAKISSENMVISTPPVSLLYGGNMKTIMIVAASSAVHALTYWTDDLETNKDGSFGSNDAKYQHSFTITTCEKIV